jgi:hypothetical protein
MPTARSNRASSKIAIVEARRHRALEPGRRRLSIEAETYFLCVRREAEIPAICSIL